jgi:hypothetical protein
MNKSIKLPYSARVALVVINLFANYKLRFALDYRNLCQADSSQHGYCKMSRNAHKNFIMLNGKSIGEYKND